ncbi:ABC transporter ATP-binding protein [Duganella hordei]|uniref:ABC transporter ATP-binding protein n=1 Tax=Duganella hordei TaxID=2865934 RepID=UPI0030E891D0
MTQVVLRHIDLSYQGVPVLRDVNLTVGAGQFCVFIGPSGCGKSSLLRLIAGLENPTGGSIALDGAIINHVAPAERNLAMVFQNYALYPHMSVYDNMAFGLQRKGLPRVDIERRVAEASRILQLDALLARKPGALSGGQRQRVAIGRAIVKQPKVFLFDEPLSNLDASLRAQTRLEIARLHRDLDSASMIYVTHDQVEAMTLADQVVLLRPAAEADGGSSVAQAGSPLDLYHHPANLFAARFMGSPTMNLLPATVLAPDAGAVTLLVLGQRCAAGVEPHGLVAGQPVTIGIRPEHIELGSGPWLGNVAHVEALGEHCHVHVCHDDRSPPLIAKTMDETVRVGDTLPFDLPTQTIHLFDASGKAQRRLRTR